MMATKSEHMIDGLNVEITQHKGEIKIISINGLVQACDDEGDSNVDLVITKKSSDCFEVTVGGNAEYPDFSTSFEDALWHLEYVDGRVYEKIKAFIRAFIRAEEENLAIMNAVLNP